MVRSVHATVFCAAATAFAAACGSPVTGVDAGRLPDAGQRDAGVDGGIDAGFDGGGDGGTDAGRTEVDAFDAFCERYGVARCEAMVRCKLAAAVDSCTADLAHKGIGVPCLPAERDSLTAQRLSFDADAGAACLTAMRVGPGCTADVPELDDFDCDRALTGNVGVGGTCAVHRDCTPGAYCTSDIMCPGSCSVRKAAGQAAARDEECLEGHYRVAGLCHAPLHAGDACVIDGFRQRCASGLFCDSYGDGTCKAQLGVDGGCPNGDECAAPLRCTDFGCQPVGLVGDACTRPSPWADRRHCAQDLVCDATPQPGATGVCSPRRTVGEPCLGGDCGSGAFCTGATSMSYGRCAAKLSEGVACPPTLDNTACRLGLYCPLAAPNSVCTPRVPRGEPCSDGAPFECESGLTCSEAGRCAPTWCSPAGL